MRENRSGILSPRKKISEAGNSHKGMSASPQSGTSSEIYIENEFDLSFEEDSVHSESKI
jgi:hypothetical protein